MNMKAGGYRQTMPGSVKRREVGQRMGTKDKGIMQLQLGERNGHRLTDKLIEKKRGGER